MKEKSKGCGLCPVAIAIGLVGLQTRVYSWTRVCILTCLVAIATGHKPFPKARELERRSKKECLIFYFFLVE